uniref:Uncharacterized protein n=1 Tax=Hucho hucho TaxID=62062 RepID=A0A4W5PTH6_9TELE
FLKKDLCSLLHQDEELARQLVELGYRGSGEVLKREELETRKTAADASRLSKGSQQKLYHLEIKSTFETYFLDNFSCVFLKTVWKIVTCSFSHCETIYRQISVSVSFVPSNHFYQTPPPKKTPDVGPG